MLFKLAAFSAIVIATPAAAQSITSTYSFTGNCVICDTPNSPAIATLVLRDYTPGTALTDANFVHLFYLSSQTIFDFSGGNLSGVLGTAPGAYDVSFVNLVDFGFFSYTSSFRTYRTGSFSANPPFTDGQDIDAGNQGTWTLVGAPPVTSVPEPASWAMMVVGFGGLGFAMRSRKVTTTASYA